MAFSDSPGSKYLEILLIMKPVFSWYAVYTTSRAEKKVKERLEEKQVETYLPLRTEYRIWSDRKKKVSVPLIAGYIFVRVTQGQFLKVLETPGVVAFLREQGKAVAIPDRQIERLRFVEEHAEAPLEMVYQEIPVGSIVEIVRGNLAGFRGEMIKWSEKYKIVLRLDKLGCALVSVGLGCVEQVKQPS